MGSFHWTSIPCRPFQVEVISIDVTEIMLVFLSRKLIDDMMYTVLHHVRAT